MSTHSWGDEDFDWQALDEVVRYVDHVLRKWGRVNVHQTKEKFGQLRCYCSLGWHQLHSITHPGHAFSRYPSWLWKLDCKYGSYIIPFLCNWWVVPFHKWLYRKVHADMVKKYPHIKHEILDCADFSELLRGV